MLRDASLLITGGTGSFGRAFVRQILGQYPDIGQLIIFSRDEQKQYEMAQEYPRARYPALRFVLGDVRDEQRLIRSLQGVDYVVHAAALKHVPIAEENPWECIRTNVMGAENLINAALETGVKRVIALSTDKAAAPINLYGASKLCADKLFIAANNLAQRNEATQFSVVRYGNFMGSRGSVVPHFLKARHTGVLPITHPDMTRFGIRLDRCIELLLYALAHSWGGEIFIPKIPCFRVADLATAIGPDCRQQIIGIRPGEKLHEDLITPSDALNTLEFAKHYVIGPTLPLWDTDEYLAYFKGKRVEQDFSYHSNRPADWLSIEALRQEVEAALNIQLAPL
ncbi:MAG: UDP-N-acetylglucosamine 4,6-dehydratase (inverting) [Bacteroidetes bacterium]|jgi:UDP-N-acetylglucosamine 4,6-dehydratase|nr:UDP-N-acetylglucosamine 4,6-dehydratase (inverting) [Bacteroidota bacterium]